MTIEKNKPNKVTVINLGLFMGRILVGFHQGRINWREFPLVVIAYALSLIVLDALVWYGEKRYGKGRSNLFVIFVIISCLACVVIATSELYNY